MARTRLDAHAPPRYSRGYRQRRRAHLLAGSCVDYRPVDRGRRRRIPRRRSSAARIPRLEKTRRKPPKIPRSITNKRLLLNPPRPSPGGVKNCENAHVFFFYLVRAQKRSPQNAQPAFTTPPPPPPRH